VEIIPYVFYIFVCRSPKKFMKITTELRFIIIVFFYKIYTNNSLIIFNHIFNMTIKSFFSQIIWSFYWNYITYPFSFLLPKNGYTSSYLIKRINLIFVSYYNFSFNKISNIWVIINTSNYETCSCHRMSASWDYYYWNDFLFEIVLSLFDISLYNWYSPKRIDIL